MQSKPAEKNNMKKSTILLVVISLISGTAATMSYLSWFDSVDELRDCRQGQDALRERNRFAHEVMVKMGSRWSRADLKNMLQMEFPDKKIHEDTSRLSIDDLVFKFKGSSLVGTEYLDDWDRQR